MFKVGQVWRGDQSGYLYLVIRVLNKHRATVRRIKGPDRGITGWLGVSAATRRFTLIGNNYKPKALPEQRGCRKEDC